MNLNHSRKVVKRTIGMSLIFFAVLLIAKLDAAESEITYESPNAKFAIRNFKDGRVELVALPSRRRVLKLDSYGELDVSWSPDSRRFTACESAFEDGVQLYEPKIYELEGATFRLVKLPDLTLPPAEWPEKKGRKGAFGREFILPARWLDSKTLVLKRECQCTIFGQAGDEKEEKEWSLSHEITIALDRKHRASIQKVTKLE